MGGVYSEICDHLLPLSGSVLWVISLYISLAFRSVADASEKDLVTLGFQVSESLAEICWGNSY